MKIHQIPLGARFEFEGEEYVKSGPLFGTGKAGQRLIPRYAVLKLLDGGAGAAQTRQAAGIPREDVIAAFAAFYDECMQQVPPQHQPALEAARTRFLQALG